MYAIYRIIHKAYTALVKYIVEPCSGALESQNIYVCNVSNVIAKIYFYRVESNFDELEYLIEEGGGGLRFPIGFQFQSNQNPFNITICPVNISVAENMGLGELIDSDTINEVSRATAGIYT